MGTHQTVSLSPLSLVFIFFHRKGFSLHAFTCCVRTVAQSRFYGLQNMRLEKEIADLKENMGKEATRIKKMYETEIEEVKLLLNKAQNERGVLEERLRKTERALLDLDNKCVYFSNQIF